jgi:hypothetical protein
MKKAVVFLICAMLLMNICFVSAYGGFWEKFWGKITGKSVSSEEHLIGPTAEEQNCMKNCMGCVSIGEGCTGNQEECMTRCGAKKPESTSETSCMEKCVVEGCGEFDFACQNKNKEKCEKECNMIKEPEAKNEEEKCIRDCVNAHSPGTICKPSKEGEQGNDVCQMCAKQCVHLYAGPCLDDAKLKAKQKECETCEHCYGEPIMGDSGEGWECIVNVECKDASGEWGDMPGIGEGIAKIADGVGNAFEKIGEFIGGLFGSNEEENKAVDNSVESSGESSGENTGESSGENSG